MPDDTPDPQDKAPVVKQAEGKPTMKPGDKGAADKWGQSATLGNEINPSDVIEKQKS